MFTFSTKANTLAALSTKVTAARLLPQYVITVQNWQTNAESILQKLQSECEWHNQLLVVRSSALVEDTEDNSMAGKFSSFLKIKFGDELKQAIGDVIASYGNEVNPLDQILIQPMLNEVNISGVIFSIDPNSMGNYLVINYDDFSGSTESITSGNASCAKTYYHYRNADLELLPPALKLLAKLVEELEHITGVNKLDIEFAVAHNELYLLQVRHLIIQNAELANNQHDLRLIHEVISTKMQPQPHLLGQQSIFGVMPDWNPAEIIGLRPKPLALSVYREVVTDAIWAYQRHNYGYRDLRSFPLMLSFGGIPYIDVRVSFNSFIPRDLAENIAERLVNYYLDRLRNNTDLHDKVEFEIIFSCYTFDLPERIKILTDYGFSSQDQENITSSLLKITNDIIHSKKNLWKLDLEKVSNLQERRASLLNSGLDPLSTLYWLIEDTKRYGTLPFAGLARAGFIAIQLLNSLVDVGIFSKVDREAFMASINSVSSQMNRDLYLLPKQAFLEKYGHLRPGTYDIMSYRYDEAPDLYFDWEMSKKVVPNDNHKKFNLSLDQIRKIDKMLKAHSMNVDIIEFFDFITAGIEAREYSKFIFSKNLSDFMLIFEKYANNYGLTREDCSYIPISTIIDLYHSCEDPEESLKTAAEQGKKRYNKTKNINLPPLITNPDQVWSFELPATQPNFITQKKCTGEVQFSINPETLHDSIVLIPSADPGYDWIFTKDIKGFITKYGGVNSHMAIRAGELSIPAVIGAGEVLYERYQQAKILEIDACNKKVEILCLK
ncbi:PEP/pyruvate-binding domain-containing protein [Rickettsiales endosymbiont of Stachyamoeba lipophora]|uniref:PEP/pyruvate-binding domain-containing protein n=1 Tax=Rickettsiales endosymbiont of Stachyamoeba lipophora TaxID=2486578 RepID=UPI0019D1DD26|nr:PEP/pyruvate-binding domain-containing protein [Rickettsiales endosymbiont of Stachyamoeba lipophora]